MLISNKRKSKYTIFPYILGYLHAIIRMVMQQRDLRKPLIKLVSHVGNKDLISWKCRLEKIDAPFRVKHMFSCQQF